MNYFQQDRDIRLGTRRRIHTGRLLPGYNLQNIDSLQSRGGATRTAINSATALTRTTAIAGVIERQGAIVTAKGRLRCK